MLYFSLLFGDNFLYKWSDPDPNNLLNLIFSCPLSNGRFLMLTPLEKIKMFSEFLKLNFYFVLLSDHPITLVTDPEAGIFSRSF